MKLTKIKALFRRKPKVVEEKPPSLEEQASEAVSEKKPSEPETAESIDEKQ